MPVAGHNPKSIGDRLREARALIAGNQGAIVVDSRVR